MRDDQQSRDVVGRVPPRGAEYSKTPETPSAAWGHAAYNIAAAGSQSAAPSRAVSHPNEPPPRRLRRLHRVWPDRDGNVSYLLTICVNGRAHVLDNNAVLERLVAFLLDSPERYQWYGRRFVIMPDHLHVIAHMGYGAVRLGQWIKALKAVVGGLERRAVGPVAAPGGHEFTRIPRSWRWQDGFHDHKFRTPESEARKWEYVCLNPVRYHLVSRPEEWPFGGEIFYGEEGGPKLVRGTPPLLETGMLIEDDGTPRGGTRLTPPPVP